MLLGASGSAFSPDGALLASSGFDSLVRVWDVRSGRVMQELQGHTAGVQGVAFTPDGATLVSGSDDGTIRLWDARTGAGLATLRAEGPYAGMHIGGVTGLTAAQKAALVVLGAVDDTHSAP